MSMQKFTRTQAATAHLLFCVLIAIGVMAVFWGVWYPHGLTIVAGATELLLIIVGVDVVVGPVLTFVLFVPGKKGLYFDLAMIAFLQIAALAYGIHVMAQTRPIFLVAIADRLQLVSANEIDDAELAKASDVAFSYRSWIGPVLAGSRDPEDPDEYMALTMDVFNGGPEIDRRPKYFVPFLPAIHALTARAKRLGHWSDSTEPGAKEALTWAGSQHLDVDRIAVVPVSGRSGMAAMLVDAASGELLRVFGFHPGLLALPEPAEGSAGPATPASPAGAAPPSAQSPAPPTLSPMESNSAPGEG